MPRFTIPFHACPILVPGRPPAHLPPGRIIAMPWTLAFAPTTEDLEEDFFGLPIATFAPPPGQPEEEPPAEEDSDLFPAA
jgi:hypothetical protein